MYNSTYIILNKVPTNTEFSSYIASQKSFLDIFTQWLGILDITTHKIYSGAEKVSRDLSEASVVPNSDILVSSGRIPGGITNSVDVTTSTVRGAVNIHTTKLAAMDRKIEEYNTKLHSLYSVIKWVPVAYSSVRNFWEYGFTKQAVDHTIVDSIIYGALTITSKINPWVGLGAAGITFILGDQIEESVFKIVNVTTNALSHELKPLTSFLTGNLHYLDAEKKVYIQDSQPALHGKTKANVPQVNYASGNNEHTTTNKDYVQVNDSNYTNTSEHPHAIGALDVNGDEDLL